MRRPMSGYDAVPGEPGGAELHQAASHGARLMKPALNRGELLDEEDRKRSNLNYAVIAVACAGFLLTVCEVELLWTNKNVPNLWMQMIKLMGTFLTLGLFYLLLRYYSVLHEMKDLSGQTVNGASYVQQFVLSGLLWPFLIDAVVCLIHPLPFVNYTIDIYARGHYYYYSSDAFICVLMMLRVYLFLPRFISEVSGMVNEKTRLIGLMNHVEVDTAFVCRHLLNSSLTVLFFVFIAALLTLSYAMVIFERPLGGETNLGDYENSLWVIIITMTTVGYGDTYPKSPCGRGVAIVAAFFSVIILALAVNAVTQRLSLTRDESKTLEFLADIHDKQDRKHLAAKVIQRGFEAYKRLKQLPLTNADPLKPKCGKIKDFPKFCSVAQDFAKKRSEGASISTDVPLMMMESTVQIKRIEDKVEDMERSINEMHSMLKVLAGGGTRTHSSRT